MLNSTPNAAPVKVAIYRTSSLGDVVLGFACLELLRQLPTPSQVTWIGRGPTLELIRQGWPSVNIVEVAKSDTLKEIQATTSKVGQVHIIIDLQQNLRSKYFIRYLNRTSKAPVFRSDKAQIMRSKLIAAARIRGRRSPLPDSSLHALKPQYELMLDALKKGLRQHLPVDTLDTLVTAEAYPQIPLADAGVSNIPSWQKELRFGSWLAVAPGASTATKKAPETTFLSIIRSIRERLDKSTNRCKSLGLVMLGDESDCAAARKILDELNWQDPVLNLSGKLSLWESSIALGESTCLLSNDSSLGHIAEAVGTPTAILFGPTIESFGFAPRMKESRAFSIPLGCRPCSKHGKTACRFEDHLCFHSLPIDAIAEHLSNLLDTKTASK